MSRDENGETRVTVRLDAELDSLIENEREQGRYMVPKSEVVRAALKEYFADEAENSENAELCA